MPKVTIIGGGIAGCTTALELSKEGYDVTILEQKPDILLGTSAATPGRMGLGYHYFHTETAKHYMENTVGFMKKYPDCFIGSSEKNYLQRGRYFIVKDSLVSTQELMANYSDISRHYQDMCEMDSELKPMFNAYNPHRVLRQKEFQDDIVIDRIALAIETQERLLDWDKFNQYLRHELEEEKIEIVVNAKVEDINLSQNGGFQLSTTSENQNMDIINSDYVINCSWQNIELLNQQLNIGDSHFKQDDLESSITSRLKLLAEVELPDNLKERPSMFFCIGPHAMFSNLGDGIGRITYAPVTNFATTTNTQMPDQFQRWLDEGLRDKETQDYGQAIIDGVSQYIPAMANATIRQVIPGIVKSKGSVNINDVNSPFHKRDYSGVEEQQIGWIDNASMKLFYCFDNAKQVADILKQQETSKKEIVNFAKIIKESRSTKVEGKILESFFVNHLQRNFTGDELTQNLEETCSIISQTTEIKKIVLTEVTHLKSNHTVKPKDNSLSLNKVCEEDFNPNLDSSNSR